MINEFSSGTTILVLMLLVLFLLAVVSESAKVLAAAAAAALRGVANAVGAMILVAVITVLLFVLVFLR